MNEKSKTQYVECIMEKSQLITGSKVNEYQRMMVRDYGTNEQSIDSSMQYKPMILELNRMEWSLYIQCLYYWVSLTRSARMEETSMNQIKSIKLYSKLISIELPRMNEVDRHFEDLEYLNTINIQYS